MAGKVLHEDLACLFEIRTVHPQPQEPCAECVFLILIVDILCLDALLADSLLVHQHRQLCKSRQVFVVRCSREAGKGDLLGGDFQAFQCSTMFSLIVADRIDEVHDGKGAAIVLQLLDQPLFHMEVSSSRLADELAAAVKKVDQVAESHTVVLADRECKFQVQRHLFRLIFCLLRFCIRLILYGIILSRIVWLQCILGSCFRRFIFCGICIFGFLLVQNLQLCFGHLLSFRFGHRLLIHIRCQPCVLRLVIRALNTLAAADQSLIQQGRQQLGICILRLDQKVAIPVDGVAPDVVRIQRCFGIVRVDAGQLLHAFCEGLSLGYVQFKFQHNSSLLFVHLFLCIPMFFSVAHISL